MQVNRKPIINEINITPLTDIFLVLLIIMMVVAPMLEYPGLKLSVPSIGPDANTKDEPKTVALLIDAQDQYTLNGQMIPLQALTGEIRRLAKEKPDGVVIQSHPQASHNAMAQAMDAVQQAGVTKLAVQALEGDSATPSASAAEESF